VSDLCQGEAG